MGFDTPVCLGVGNERHGSHKLTCARCPVAPFPHLPTTCRHLRWRCSNISSLKPSPLRFGNHHLPQTIPPQTIPSIVTKTVAAPLSCYHPCLLLQAHVRHFVPFFTCFFVEHVAIGHVGLRFGRFSYMGWHASRGCLVTYWVC